MSCKENITYVCTLHIYIYIYMYIYIYVYIHVFEGVKATNNRCVYICLYMTHLMSMSQKTKKKLCRTPSRPPHCILRSLSCVRPPFDMYWIYFVCIIYLFSYTLVYVLEFTKSTSHTARRGMCWCRLTTTRGCSSRAFWSI